MATIQTAASEIGPLREVIVSANYIDGRMIGEFLCRLNISNATRLIIYVQRSSASVTSSRSHFGAEFFIAVSQCFTNIDIRFVGCDVFDESLPQMKTQCDANRTNSHHVKAIVLRGPRGVVYAFGSGNFTVGSMTRNVENWVVMTNFSPDGIARFDCVFRLLQSLSEHPELRYWQQRAIYDGCAALGGDVPDIRFYLLPFGEKGYKEELGAQFDRAQKVTIVGQFIESEFLFDLIDGHPNVSVTILVDSAYFYATSSDIPINFISQESARRLLTFVANRKNVTLRYIQTNHNYVDHGQTNTVHARTIMFENSEEVVLMIGSAHFRDGSLRSNTEQQIFLYGDLATSQRFLMNDLMARSVAVGRLPTKSTPAKSN